MRIILLFVILAFGGAWFYPQYAEGTDNACSAFEKRMAALVQSESKRVLPENKANDPKIKALVEMMNSVVAGAKGAIASAYIREKFPMLPPSAGCVAAFWKITVDPDLTQYIRGKI